jgi:hypothetical protein
MVYKTWFLSCWDESIGEDNACGHVFSEWMAYDIVDKNPKVSIGAVGGLTRETILSNVYDNAMIIDDLVSQHPIFAKDKFKIFSEDGYGYPCIVDYYPIDKYRVDKIKSIGI